MLSKQLNKQMVNLEQALIKYKGCLKADKLIDYSIKKNYTGKKYRDFLASCLSLPKKDCIINNYAVDSNYPVFNRLEYCINNCQFECLNNQNYKKI